MRVSELDQPIRQGRPFFVGALILLCVPLAGCFSDKSDMNRIQKSIANNKTLNDSLSCNRVLHSWIKCAQNNDIDGMIVLTSRTTVTQEGSNNLKKVYTEDSAPALRRFRYEKNGGEAKYFDNGKNTTGWIFKSVCTSADGKEAKFQFVVLNEDGVIGVGSFGLWK